MIIGTMSPKTTGCTVAEYLALRLSQLGIGHLFAVPGNFCADFLAAAKQGGLSVIGANSELEAGYAADAYSRVAGFGAVCVTHGVGAMSLVNATAGSYVERCPVVVINGGPNPKEISDEVERGILFLHSTGRLHADFDVFQNVTAAADIINDADHAPGQIDRVLEVCMRTRRPVYIEISLDTWKKQCISPLSPLAAEMPDSNPDALREAVQEAVARICRAKLPVLWGGEEIQRFGLQDSFEKLVAMTGLMYTTTLLGKAIISEDNPAFIGVYDSKYAPRETRMIVEASDCMVALGTTISDFIGEVVARDFPQMIVAVSNGLRIGFHTYPEIVLGEFVRALTDALAECGFKPPPRPAAFEFRKPKLMMESALKMQAATAEENQLTFDSFFCRMATFLDADMLVLADTSLCLFPSAELVIKRRSGYIAQAVWLSIGYTTGGTVGASLAYADGPVVTFAGDGGFQMIPQMLSTLARNNSSAIVFVFNNSIYGMEQFLVNSSYFSDPSAKPEFYNNLPDWKYACLAEAFGVRVFIKVQTNHELEKALATIGRRPVGPVLVEVVIPAKDLPACFRAMTAHPARLS